MCSWEMKSGSQLMCVYKKKDSCSEKMRMKIVLLFHGLLLTLDRSAKGYEKMEQGSEFYIYQGYVEIRTFYCFYNIENDFHCDHFHPNSSSPENVLDAKRKCNFSGKISTPPNATMCELFATANLLEDEVKLGTNTTCHFSRQYCYDKMILVVWNTEDVCQNLVLEDRKFYNVSADVDGRMLLRSGENYLELKEKIVLCDSDIWITNSSGLIVARSFQHTIIKRDTIKNKNPSALSWYIYKYELEVDVFFCNSNKNRTCAEIGDSKAVSSPNKCVDYFCFSSSCEYSLNHSELLCSKRMKVDLENDQVKGLNPFCTYSSGQCNLSKAYWRYVDGCEKIKKISKVLVSHRWNKSEVVSQSLSLTLDILRKGTLCGSTVWYTNVSDFIVLDNEFLFNSTHEAPLFENNIKQQNEEINFLRKITYSLALFFLLCLVWCILNVSVNYCTLRKLNSKLSKGKISSINSVFDSLTMRRLFFGLREKKPRPDDAASQLYESIYNDL